MSRFKLASATIVVGAFVIATLPNGVPGFGSGEASAQKNPYVCMTDDGYGRYRPCSAGYKASNPNWQAGGNCFTDEGYGRYRPCSAGYKAKQPKK